MKVLLIVLMLFSTISQQQVFGHEGFISSESQNEFGLSGLGDESDEKLLKMLEEAKVLEHKRQYVDALALALEIQDLARKAEADIIFVKAIEIELSVRQWFGFDDFHNVLQRIDEHLAKPFKRTEMLLRIFKIKALASNYSSNKFKIDNNIDDGIINEMPVQWSKTDFLTLIDNEIDLITKVAINDLLTEAEIKMVSRFDAFDGVFPAKLSERALITAIEAIGSFSASYQLSEEPFYVPLNQFVEIYKNKNELHPALLKAKYYALLFDRVADEHVILKNWLDLQRLYDLFQLDEHFNKLDAYEQALLQHVQQDVSTSTVASARLAAIYNSRAQKFFTDKKLKEAVLWQKMAMQLCEDALKNFPKSDGAPDCKSVIEGVKQSLVSFEVQETVLPNRSFPVHVSYRNQAWVKVSAYKISSRRYLEYLSNNTMWEIGRAQPVWQHEVKFPVAEGFFNRSVTAVLPKLAQGYYVLVIEPEKLTDDKQLSQLFVTATNLSCITQPHEEKTTVFVDYADGGNAAKSFHVTLIDRKYDRKTRMAYFENQETLKGENGRMEFAPGVRAGFIQISNQGDSLLTRFSHNYIRKVQSREHQQVKLFTDRSIYRPGQMVYFKGISAKVNGQDFSPAQSQNFRLSLVDASYKTLEEKQLKTNDLGSFQGSFKIPESVRPGRMQLKTNGGAAYFEVQYYKRPVFDAEWVVDNNVVLPGEEVSLKLDVKSFAGQPLQNAEVETTIKLHAGYFKFFGFFNDDVLYKTVNSKTNQDGFATISFVSTPENDVQRYTISSKITAADGSSREFSYIYVVSPKPLIIELDNQSPVQSVNHAVKFGVRGINGESIHEAILIKVRELIVSKDYFYRLPLTRSDAVLENEDSWKNLFPGAEWHQSLNYNALPKGNPIYTKSITGKELGVLDGLKLNEGVFAFEFWIADTLYSTVYQSFVDENQKKLTLAEPFVLTVSEHHVMPGQSITLSLATRFKQAEVKLFVTDKEGILLDNVVSLKSKKKRISLDIQPRSEGKINVQAFMIHEGQLFEIRETVEVKQISRSIDVEFISIRNQIVPGDKEVWQVKLTQNGRAVSGAEVLAAMYDMSLDAFIPHRWQVPFKLSMYGSHFMRAMNHQVSRVMQNSGTSGATDYHVDWTVETPFDNAMPMRSLYLRMGSEDKMLEGVELEEKVLISDDETPDQEIELVEDIGTEKTSKNNAIRTNFNETAFFYPVLSANQEGVVEFKFTAPEAMSRWKLQILAHDKQMAAGYAVHEVVTKKPLMVIPNQLRFVHHGDQASISTTVFNATDSVIVVQPSASIINPVNGQSLEVQISEDQLTIEPQQSVVFDASFVVPGKINVLQYTITGKTGKYTDGEMHQIPVFPSRQSVINSLAIWNKPNTSKTYKFVSLQQLFSSTSEEHHVSIELTTNPLWIAIKALPAVYKTSVTSAVGLAQNFYITAKTNEIIHLYPEIHNVLKVWKDAQPQALQSEFTKNEDLKNLLIGQTPWEEVAQKQELQRAVLLEMLNVNFVNNNYQLALLALENQQLENGAFSWRPGMRASWYFTLKTAHLLSQALPMTTEHVRVKTIVVKAVAYLDSEVEQRYDNLLRYQVDTAKYVTSSDLLLYFLTKQNLDGNYKPNGDAQKFFMNHSVKYEKMGLAQMVLSGMVNRNAGNEKYAMLVVDRLRQRAVVDAENGMYWRDLHYSWNWEDAPVITQSLIIQYFQSMKQPETQIEAMKLWLIRQKQGQAWLNAENSLAAIEALLTNGQKWLENKAPVIMKIGALTINSADNGQEAGSGYFRNDLGTPQPGMESVAVQNNGATPVWGAVYHSFTEQFDAIKPWQDELAVKRELFEVVSTEKGEVLKAINNETKLEMGARVQVRLTISSKRNIDFVALTSPHAACFEPVEQLSGYTWAGGASYYKEVHDTEHRFFFDNLKKGDVVITYSLFVERQGTYNAGAAKIQSVYAPEFGANSAGYRIKVEK